ncbi:hypothetical protein NDU88_004042 [Pleurodeles waltl]|uniref:Uncharacterized protein n=1 Tax=Pleurodeles waltl TaxID=8319 RepID=A0AAV7NSN6_PLEWA|nr:hypothetical protein NDU88_004042 [Pleurodeles waltl]
MNSGGLLSNDGRLERKIHNRNFNQDPTRARGTVASYLLTRLRHPSGAARASRENSVTRCPDDQDAGIGTMTLDFRVPGAVKREDGRERSSEEPDATEQDAEETTKAERGDQEETE